MIYTQFYGCTKYQIGRIFSLCSRPDTEFDNSLEIEHTDKPDISDRILDVDKTLSISIVDIFAAQRNVAPSTFIIPPNVLLDPVSIAKSPFLVRNSEAYSKGRVLPPGRV